MGQNFREPILPNERKAISSPRGRRSSGARDAMHRGGGGPGVAQRRHVAPCRHGRRVSESKAALLPPRGPQDKSPQRTELQHMVNTNSALARNNFDATSTLGWHEFDTSPLVGRWSSRQMRQCSTASMTKTRLHIKMSVALSSVVRPIWGMLQARCGACFDLRITFCSANFGPNCRIWTRPRRTITSQNCPRVEQCVAGFEKRLSEFHPSGSDVGQARPNVRPT